jgi:rSAM/selenodomain-associated transferase 1
MNNALIIFVRNPELGKVKTRLASSIGNEKTLEIYKYLLQHTQKVADSIYADKFIFYVDSIAENDIWNDYHKLVQSNGDLGQRMQNAFQFVFSLGYAAACIIGSDCLDLNKEILNNTFAALKEKDAVLGPATDGGYYLLGLQNTIPSIFANKNWSTNTVCKDTIANLETEQKTFTLLQVLSDIDTIEDANKYPKLVNIYIT